MARTQAADYDQKRETITNHAARMFARQGFSGASISEIAASCKVSKSLIYHYYSSKEDILFDVMNDHMEALLEVTQLPANDAGRVDPKDAFRQLTRALLRCYTGAANRQKVLLYELDNLPKKNRDEIIAKQRTVITRFENALAAIAPSVMNRKSHLRAKIMLFFGMLNWSHTWFNSAGDISRDELADMATETILKSLVSAPASG